MEESKLDKLLYQIITDRRYIRAMRSNGEPVDLMIRSLTPQESLYSKFLYDLAFSKARKNGLPTEKECMSDAINKGLWDRDKDKLISLYEAEIDRLEKSRKDYAHNKGRTIKLRNDIIKTKKKLEALNSERDSLILYSAESAAKSEQSNYLISRVVLKIDDTQLWPTFDDFLNERDSGLIRSIISEYSKLETIKEADVRAIARSGIWSVMWRSAKNGSSLFGKSSTTMSSEQISLSYWSMMYDSVYESMDRPSDKIIENDEALDKWFEDQREKREKESKRQKYKSKVDRHPEVFVMATSDEEADEVYDLNDKWSLARIRSESKKLEERQGKEVSEWELRHGSYIKQALMNVDPQKAAYNRKMRVSNRSGFIG